MLEPINLDYESVDGGKRLLFSSGCQRKTSITVILLAQQVKEGRIVTRQIRRTILVDESSLSDEPQPDPSPPADDPVAKSPVYEAILDAWPKIRTDAAKELSLSVAGNFEAVGLKCSANDFQQPDEIWLELSSLNRQTLQIETAAWDPVAQALQEKFKELAPRDVPAHAVHLRAAATAIREAFEKSKQQTSNRRTRP